MEDTFSVRPSVCFEVQKITGVSIGNGNQRNYQVQWAPTWVSGFHLVGCEHLIEEFIQKQSEKGELVDGTIINSMTNKEVLQNNITEYVLEEDNVTEEICKRVSMVVNDDHLLKDQKINSSLYSSIANNNGSIKVICMETNASNESLSTGYKEGGDNTNPNFEWVQRSVHDNEDNTNAANNDVTDANIDKEDIPLFSGHQRVTPLLHFSKEFINKEKLGSDNIFQTEVKEEIILVETPESIQTVLCEDDKNKHESSLKKPAKKFECNMCHKVFKNNSGLARHWNKEHEAKNTLQCDICNRMCRSKASLSQHKLIHVSEKQYKCDVCSKVFSKNINLRSHTCTTQTRRPRSHQCCFCVKTFSTSAKLIRHVRVHTGERPFQCKICKKAFQRKDHLQKHTQTHEKVT